jgi:ribosomal protein L33
MRIELIRGKFGEYDKKISLTCSECGHNHILTNAEIVEILTKIRDNENKREGKGWLNQHGDLLFRRLLNKIINGATYQELLPYCSEGFSFESFDKAGFDYKEWEPVFCDKCGQQAYCPGCHQHIWLNKKEFLERNKDGNNK